MPSSRTTTRELRAARQRLRSYQARKTVHDRQAGRRRRDNIVAIVAVLIVATVTTVAQVLYVTVGPGVPVEASTADPATETPQAETPAADQNVGDVPSSSIAEGRAWTGELDLNDVPLGIRIDGDLAPQAASVFISLSQAGFYNGNQCHRLTAAPTAKVIQCGAPDGTTTIDPGFSFGPIENAPADGSYPAGTIAIARADSPYSQSTQFFIAYGNSSFASADGYSVIGQVTSGLDTFVTEIASAGVTADAADPTDGAPAVPTTITGLSVQ